jgi:NAD(P)-dependent dehydrogenase (short-subunit alcohol dehydrogenase family)
MGLGKCNTKMGVVAKEEAVLLVGASGGIGTALLEYFSSHSTLRIIPTFNERIPSESGFLWMHYNGLNFQKAKETIEDISTNYDVRMIIDASGVFFANKLQDSTIQEINNVFLTNLTAPMILAKNAQKMMCVGGKIVFLSSIVSTMQLVGSSIYAASKAGLERGVVALAPEFAQSGHGICALRLGYMDYGMTYKIKQSRRIKILEQLPENKFISIEKLGDQILNILHCPASDVNGRIFEVI